MRSRKKAIALFSRRGAGEKDEVHCLAQRRQAAKEYMTPYQRQSSVDFRGADFIISAFLCAPATLRETGETNGKSRQN